MADANRYVKAGIKALKNGKRADARKLLEKAISLEEKHEHAWLWLSAAVDDKEEKHICLDNVLTINPANKVARKGLVKLGFSVPKLPKNKPNPPPPPDKKDAPYWMHPVEIELNAEPKSKFNDVWTGNDPICAYCAAPIKQQDQRCPSCNQKMYRKEPINAKFSTSLKIWLGFRIFSNVMGLLGLIFILLSFDPFLILVTMFGQLISIGYTVALYKRQPWAYWLAVCYTILSFLGLIAYLLFDSALFLDVGPLPPFFAFISLFAGFFLAAIVIANILLVITSHGDFVRVRHWQAATANPKITDPYRLDQLGKMYAKQKMWATAVLYWQRAVGVASGNPDYLMHLANGYANLNFIERSLDTYQTAYEKSHDSKLKQRIRQKMADLEQSANLSFS